MRLHPLSSFKLLAGVAALMAALSGCTDSSLSQSQGIFLDSAVGGVSYSGDNSSSGVTSDTGTFSFYPGEKITFSVGAMTLGTATGSSVVTPSSFESTVDSLGDHSKRVLRALQTLDSDNDPSNGISITASARASITSKTHLATATDAALLSAVQQAKPGVALKDEALALEHFAETLVKQNVKLKAPATSTGTPVTLTLMHTNDTHSRMESFTDTVLQGGVARRKTLIERTRNEVDAGQACKNVLLVDGGDFSQGTVYFNAWEGSESIMAMNDMQYDVATLGNHEFDLGPAKLARALKGEKVTIAGVDYPTEKPNFSIVASNLDTSTEASLKGLVQKFKIIDRCGQKYGILGAVTDELPLIASPGPNLKVLDYVSSINAASALLKAQGIDKIILLSHYGYSIDIKKAKELSNVDIIVSAHDHKLLGSAADVTAQTTSGTYSQTSQIAGDYPTILSNLEGNKLLVVSAFEWGRWLGRLEVSFDAKGNVVTGTNKSLFVDGRIVDEEPTLKAKVANYYAPVQAFSSVQLGTSSMLFSSARGAASPFSVGVRSGETTLGNLVSDLMQAAAKASDGAVATFNNGGGLRADIKTGTITFGDALSVLPYGNTLYVMDLTGQDVIDLLEASASKVGGGGFLQLSKELRMTYCASASSCSNPLKPGGQVTSIQIAGKPVDTSKTYRVATNNFTAGGGDGYSVLKNACLRAGNYCRDTGIVQLDLLVNALKTGTPLTAVTDGRITRVE